MDVISINKALSNPTRWEILQWLKHPAEHFPPHQEVEGFGQGVCVLFIQEKSGLSQSTISHFLSVLHKAELIIPTRIGKWTYYRRNERTIRAYTELLKNQL